MTARHVVPLAVVVFALSAGQALAAQQLPNLAQQVPKNVHATQTAPFQLYFDSEVVNVGSGPLEIRGHKDTDAAVDMPAIQWVLTDGVMQSAGQVGTLHFETSFDHDHFHFKPFDHYELRRPNGTLVVTDVKQGFCLGDNSRGNGSPVYGATWCSVGHPESHDLVEGLSPGFGDIYTGNLEGQDIPINQTSVPAGDYNLVHRVNEDSNGSHGAVRETTWGDNVASAWIAISWPGGKPSVTTKRTCANTASCASTSSPPPPPPTTTTTTTQTPPPPGGGTTTTTPTTVTPAVTVDATAPALAFLSHQTERFKRRSSALWMFASCDEPCTVTAQGTISIGGAAKALRTGRTAATMPSNSRTKLVLSLTRQLRKKIRSALAHHRRVRVKVALTVLDAAGNKATLVRRLKLTR